MTDTREDTVTGGRMVTRELAEWVAGLQYEDLPDDVIEEAGRSFTDFLGECLFVGDKTPWGRNIADFCAREGGGQPLPDRVGNRCKQKSWHGQRSRSGEVKTTSCAPFGAYAGMSG